MTSLGGGSKAGTSKGSAAERKRRFVEALIANGENQTRAAIAAGYKAGRAAEQAGWRLSKDVEVRRLLTERRAVLQSAMEMDTTSVARVLRAMVFARAVDILTPKQRRKLGPLTPELEQAIVGFRFDPKSGRLVEVKFADKGAAIEKAMKHLGMFREDNTQKGDAVARLLAEIGGQRDSFKPGSAASVNAGAARQLE
jgi:hypothetical protein